jgi:hypothetical protein
MVVKCMVGKPSGRVIQGVAEVNEAEEEREVRDQEELHQRFPPRFAVYIAKHLNVVNPITLH